MSLSEVCIICLVIRGKSKVCCGGNTLNRACFYVVFCHFNRDCEER